MQHRHEVLESCCAGGHFGQVGSLLTLDFAFAILLAVLSQLLSHGGLGVMLTLDFAFAPVRTSMVSNPVIEKQMITPTVDKNQ